MQPATRSGRELARTAAAERRKARRLWRRDVFARVAGGESQVEIAAERGVSVRAVQRALKRAAAEQPKEQMRIHNALQIERLRRALRVTDKRIEQGDINGVYALAKLLPLLLHYGEFEDETLGSLFGTL